MPSPRNHVKSSWFSSRCGTTVFPTLSKLLSRTEDTILLIFRCPLSRPRGFSHLSSLMLLFFRFYAHTRASRVDRTIFLLCRVLIRLLMCSLPLLCSHSLEQKMASLFSDSFTSSPSSPFFLAAAGAFSRDARQTRRLAEAFYVDSSTPSSTSASFGRWSSLFESPTLFHSRPSSSANNETKQHVTVHHGDVFLAESSIASSPSSWHQPGVLSPSSSFLRRRDLHRENSSKQTSSHNTSNHNTNTVVGYSSLYLRDTTRRLGWQDKVALNEAVTNVEGLDLREPSDDSIRPNASRGKGLPIVPGDSHMRETSHDLQLRFQEDSTHQAEMSALTGLIHDSPFNAKVERQTLTPDVENIEMVSNSLLVFKDAGTQSQPTASTHDSTGDFSENRSISSSTSFQSHFQVATVEESGLGNKARLGNVHTKRDHIDIARSQQSISGNRAALRQSRTQEGETNEKKVSSFTVEFRFQPRRPYSTTFTVLPLLFSAPSPTSSPASDEYVPASSTPLLPNSSPSLTFPYRALVSPVAYVPTIYLIPLTIEEASTTPTQPAGVTQITVHPTIYAPASTISVPAPSSGATTSKVLKVGISEDSMWDGEKMAASSTEYQLSGAAIPLSVPTANPVQPPYAVPPSPQVLSSLHRMSLSSSGTAVMRREGLQPFPVVTDEREYSLESSSQRRRDHDTFTEKVEADLAYAFRPPRTRPNFSTADGVRAKQLPLYLPFPADAKTWWTRLFQAVHPTPRQSHVPLLSSATAAVPGSDSSRRGTADNVAPVPQPSVSFPTAFAAEVQDFRPSRRDLPLLSEVTATSAASGDANGNVSHFAKEWGQHETTQPPEGFQSKTRPPIMSKWPPQSRAQLERGDEAKTALRQIVELLSVITGIEPASLLYFLAGTRDKRPHLLRPADESVNSDKDRNIFDQLHSVKVGLRTEV